MPGLEGLWFHLATLGSVSFRIGDSAGKPLPGARLALASGTKKPEVEWVTSEAGFALALGLGWGDQVEVEAHLPGYASVQRSVRVGLGFPLWAHHEIRLLRLPYLQGIVLGEDSFPVGNGSVSLNSPRQKRELTTSEDGAFCFEGVEVNAYIELTVKGRGFATGFRQVPPLPATSATELDAIVLQSERRREGIVRSSGGKAIPAAKIALVPANPFREVVLEGLEFPSPTLTTDPEGRFELEGLPRGNRLALLVWSEGYHPSWVPLDAEATFLEIVLHPGAFIRGKVVDEDGKPAPSVIQLKVAETTLMESTDAEGHFVLGPIRPGLHRIQAVDSLLQITDGVEVEVPPEGLDNLILRLNPSLTLHGVVLGPDLQPVPEALVVLEYPGKINHQQTSREDGTFTFEELSSGAVHCKAGHPEYGSVEQVFELSTEPFQLVLQLPALDPAALSVEVVGELGPVEGAEVEATDLGFRRRKLSVATNRQGVANFPELSAGRYEVEVRGVGFLARELELVLEKGAKRVNVRLEPEALVEGQIRSISQAELEQLVPFVIHESRSRQGRVLLDRSDGSFVVEGLGPGKWDLYFQLPPFFRSWTRQIQVDFADRSFIDVDWSETDP